MVKVVVKANKDSKGGVVMEDSGSMNITVGSTGVSVRSLRAGWDKASFYFRG
jgi:hypothetical protein